MSLNEDTRTLGAERDRLQDRLDDLVETLDDAEEGAQRQLLTREARDVDQAGQAVAALVAEYGEDATVTVRGLDAIQYAAVENKTDEARATSSVDSGTPGTGRLAYAAHGLVDAPWFDDIDPGDLDAKIKSFAGLSPGVRTWVEGLVDELGAVDEGNWRGFRASIEGESTTD